MIERFFPEPGESDSIGRDGERERERESEREEGGGRGRASKVVEDVRGER